MTTAQPADRPGLPGPLAGPGGGPAALRIMLGAQLRRLREAQQITLGEAARVIRASRSRMGRLETGQAEITSHEISGLLRLYGVTDARQRTALDDLARNASARGWWHNYCDILPDWFEAYVGLEEAAIGIRAYEIQFIPGLLQTPDYARAVTLLGHPNAHPADIDRRVSLRMARQEVLARRTPPPYLWVVIDEAALRRSAGRPGVMRQQLKYLLEEAERPDITVQVIPFEAGGHAAAGGPFSILRFAEPDLPDIVYLEQLTSALYLDERDSVEHYLAVMERLCLEATPATSSGRIVHSILSDL